MLWTQLLDTISHAFITYQLRAPEIRHSILALGERLEPLATWLTMNADRAHVSALLAFRSPQIAARVAIAATCLDIALAEPLMSSDLHCHQMVENPRVPQEVLDRILACTFSRLRARRGWSRSLNGIVFTLHALAFDRNTFPSLRMISDIISWLPDLFLRLEPKQRHQLERLVLSTGEYHARLGSLDSDALAVFLGCADEEVRLHALGWLAELPAPQSSESRLC